MNTKTPLGSHFSKKRFYENSTLGSPNWYSSSPLRPHLSRASSESEWLFECDNSELPASHPLSLTLFRSPTRIMIQINLRNWLFLLFLLMLGVGWKMSIWMNRIENTVDTLSINFPIRIYLLFFLVLNGFMCVNSFRRFKCEYIKLRSAEKRTSMCASFFGGACFFEIKRIFVA